MMLSHASQKKVHDRIMFTTVLISSSFNNKDKCFPVLA